METGNHVKVSKHKDTITSANSFDTSSSSMRGSTRIPKKSKISSKMEDVEYFDNYRDLLLNTENNEENYDSLDDTDRIIISNPIISVRVNLCLEVENKELLPCLNLVVSESVKVCDLIQMAVDKFNDYFNDNNINIQFNPNYKDFELRPSKKNGRPKLDLPAIHGDSLVKDTHIENLSLKFKEVNLVIKNKKKKTKCDQCLIM